MKIDKKIFVLQQDQSDCGVACLLTVIRFHGGSNSFEHLRKLSGTTRQGTTLLGLVQAAQQIGFDAEGLEAESIDNLDELDTPAILHVQIENRLQHYVVYYPNKVSDSKKNVAILTVFDPAKGLIKLLPHELEKIWQSKALLKLVPNSEFIKDARQKLQKKTWLFNLIKKDVPILTISTILGIAISVLGISTAIFSQKLIDDILPKENMQKLWLGLFLLFLLLVARSGLSYLRGLFIVRQSMDFNNRIIQEFYNNLLHLTKNFFDTRKIGELIARMNDTGRIQTVLSVVAGSVVIDLLVVVVSLSFLFSYSAWIGLLMLFSLLIYGLILYKFHQPIIIGQKNVMAGYALAESNYVDTMQGVAEIKLTGHQSFFERLNATIYGEFQNRISVLGNLQNKFSWVSELSGIFFLTGVFGLSSWLVLNKDLKLGEMVALLSMVGSIVPSINRFIISNIQIQEAMVAFDRMFEFTSMQKEESDGAEIKEVIEEVKLNKVSFRFPGRKQILSDVSFSIRKGEMIALKGESGSGKSTLMQLLQKFYQPESGTIEVNGQNLENLNTNEWRKRLGCVPQEVKIFNGHLLYNITLSHDSEKFEKATAFCERVGFTKYFHEFPQGYLTLLGEEGINISGGQKQLVGLARALFSNPQVLLLDEATSAMDKKTEDFVLRLLFALKPEIAVLFVTHRKDTAEYCDRIVKLDSGKLVE